MKVLWEIALLVLVIINMAAARTHNKDPNSIKAYKHSTGIKTDQDQRKYTDSRLDNVWKAFKKVHSKVYESAEDSYRRSIWEENVEVIRVHNLEYDLGLHTYTMGLNEYADLSFEEYQRHLLGARQPARPGNMSKLYEPSQDVLGNLPSAMDWREKGYVTQVKNQGQCGSCWAFSSTGALEGQHFRKTGKLVSLSEQNLVDCDKTNAGCGGGWMNNAFKYVQTNGGIDTETYYPYQAQDMPSCTYNNEYVGSDCTGHVSVRPGSEGDLRAAVATVGPVAVAIDATHQSFQLYRAGVYIEPACSNTTTDHAVLAVGYGDYNGQPYWLVKNSWGTSWGMEGYIMMARNQDNQCAIASFASYPLV